MWWPWRNTQKYALRDDDDDECRDKPARSRSWLRYQSTNVVVVSDVVSDVIIKFIVVNVVSDVVT